MRDVNKEGAPRSAPRRGRVWTDEDVRDGLDSPWTTDCEESEETESADDAWEIDAAAGLEVIEHFLVEDEFERLDMWEKLPIDKQLCLVRTVIPHLPTSLANTRCVCGCGGLAHEAMPGDQSEGLVRAQRLRPRSGPGKGRDATGVKPAPDLWQAQSTT